MSIIKLADSQQEATHALQGLHSDRANDGSLIHMHAGAAGDARRWTSRGLCNCDQAASRPLMPPETCVRAQQQLDGR